MRIRLPGAIELVYDNYNALAIGFAPDETTLNAVFSIAVFPRWVSLFFLKSGPSLPDPDKILQGTGNVVRHIVLKTPADIESPAISRLMDHAVGNARKPVDPGGAARIVIKSVSAKQRPRRPAPYGDSPKR